MPNKKRIVNISIRDLIASGDGTVFVCDNTDYRLHFDFDEEWNGRNPKTARMVFSGGYRDFPFVGNDVDIDRIPVARAISFGVYAGDLKTSTPAKFDCALSICSTSGAHRPPTEDEYNKIIALIEDGTIKGDKGEPGEDYVLTEQDKSEIADIVAECFVNVSEVGQ